MKISGSTPDVYQQVAREAEAHTYNGPLLGNKRNKLLIDQTPWTDLGIILLNEISQTKEEFILYDSIYVKF